jgi:hypothetical protein
MKIKSAVLNAVRPLLNIHKRETDIVVSVTSVSMVPNHLCIKQLL